MSTPSSDGLREVRLRYGIRRLSLTFGTDVLPYGVWYTDLERAQAACNTLNIRFPKILHTVEEVELNPED